MNIKVVNITIFHKINMKHINFNCCQKTFGVHASELLWNYLQIIKLRSYDCAT